MVQAVDNTQYVIDSRDVLERIQELTDTLEDPDFYNDGDTEEAEELAALEALIEEVRDYSGDSPEDGATLINSSYFEDYARELAEEIGAYDPDAGWPNAHIDWQAAADALAIDYTEIDYNGETYLVRS